MTRPDVPNAVRAVARYSHALSRVHGRAVTQILKYLKGTRELGLTYEKGAGLTPVAYADAHFVNETFDRRSVSGGAVDWLSKTQRIIAQSLCSTWQIQIIMLTQTSSMQMC
ncbi:unnamed protein product [Choristocarpus tenellus]